MSEQSIGVGVMGCGTIGTGTVRLLWDHPELYSKRLGKSIRLIKVLEKDPTRPMPDGLRTDDVDGFFADPEIDVVVELIGGTTIASAFTRRALEAGKHVVTANKALLAKEGAELFALAREHGVTIGFEASCGGGIPIITALQFGLKANRIRGLYGILNGTCNYILTQMAEQGTSYDQALSEAQELGYAEADPTLDVGGGDTAQKIAILASLAFGVRVDQQMIRFSGIDTVATADVTAGREMGYVLKLIGSAEQYPGGLSLRVGPCFVPAHTMLAGVSQSFNALSVYGHSVGHTFYYGRGAGMMPTASAVVSDILNTASGWYADAFQQMTTWLDQPQPAELLAEGQLPSRYYMRVMARDQPGVVAQVSRILGDEQVSLAALSQHEGDGGGLVPVVMLTHQTTEGAIQRAAAAIAKLPDIGDMPVCIRILDEPEEFAE